MIIAAVLTALFGMCQLAITFLPTGSPPAFIANIGPQLRGIADAAGGMGAWIPWELAAGVAGVCFTVWLALTAVSALRWIIGWVPTMGGA